MEKSSEVVTRGVRNCNPANLRRGSQWIGLSKSFKSLHPESGTRVPVSVCYCGGILRLYDGKFCQFTSMMYGVRALLITLRTYAVKYHLTSIRQVVIRFAPSSDGNCPEKYIAFILGAFAKMDFTITQDDKFLDSSFFLSSVSVDKRKLLYALCASICFVESRYLLGVEMFDVAFGMAFKK